MDTEPDPLLERYLENGTADDSRLADDAALPAQADSPATLYASHRTLDGVVAAVCAAHGVPEQALRSHGRSRCYAAIRTEIAAVALDEGIASLADVARRFGRADALLCRAVSRHRQDTRRRIVK